MNLQPFYELKERLAYSAIAGTKLIAEDFRLKRAVEALAPLSAASPVFAKIVSGVQALMDAPEKEKGGRLLDVLGLVDAVAYTQGTVGAAGEIAPLGSMKGHYAPVSFGQLNPLLSDLQATGTGRYARIRENWIEHPAYFSDYRVLPMVVSALSETYAELADLYFDILLKQGADVIPLLKNGFDPAGKKESVQRVRLIASIAGSKENDWYLCMLPEAKKQIREALILALGGSKDNLQTLLDLAQSERGKNRDAALRALALMDSDCAYDLLNKEVEKHPESVELVVGIKTEAASNLAASAFRTCIDTIIVKTGELTKEEKEYLFQCGSAFCGKDSEAAIQTWKYAVSKRSLFSTHGMDHWLANILLDGLLQDKSRSLFDLAADLGANYPAQFLSCAFVADAIQLSKEAVYEKYSGQIIRTGFLKKENAAQKAGRLQIAKGLSYITWSTERNQYEVLTDTTNPLTNKAQMEVVPVGGLDDRWFSLLTDPKVEKEKATEHVCFSESRVIRTSDLSLDQILITKINPKNQTTCAVIGNYLYEQALHTGAALEYAPFLLKCGWANWNGYYPKCVSKSKTFSYYQARQVYDLLPMTNGDKAKEWRELDRIAKTAKNTRGTWPSDAIMQMIAHLEADPGAIASTEKGS